MITESTAFVFGNLCARTESHQQERAQKLRSTTLTKATCPISLGMTTMANYTPNTCSRIAEAIFHIVCVWPRDS